MEALQGDPVFTDLCLEPQIAGQGFINLTIRPECLAAEVSARLGDPRLGDYGITAADLDRIAEAASNRNNPTAPTPSEIKALLQRRF